jgi:lysozyme
MPEYLGGYLGIKNGSITKMSAKQKLFALLGTVAASGAILLTGAFEGTVLHTYKDPIGIITACKGHTGPELRMGQNFTPEQCDEQQYADLLKHADALQCITTALSDGEKAAYLSLAYNIGDKAFCGSSLVRLKNAGNALAACNELPKWVHAGGHVLPGLVKRRAAERDFCLKGLE